MTGRDLFKLFLPLIELASAVLRWIPQGLLSANWWCVAFLPGKLGIGVRYLVARRLCQHCGSNVLIGVGVTVDHWDRLSIGDNVTLHQYCYLDANGGIEIGDNVSIAHATSLVAFEHSWDDPDTPIKYNPLIPGRIEIGSDVWVGCGVRILSGATLGQRTVIAAGAVVTRGAYGQGVFGGVPARRLKTLPVCSESTTKLATIPTSSVVPAA